jgi:hypothetical protein
VFSAALAQAPFVSFSIPVVPLCGPITLALKSKACALIRSKKIKLRLVTKQVPHHKSVAGCIAGSIAPVQAHIIAPSLFTKAFKEQNCVGVSR